MKTWHIHIEGRVQGVGFRPFIYRLANKMNLKGDVANTPNGVHIQINAPKQILDDFIINIKRDAPKGAHISAINYVIKDSLDFESFEIVESRNTYKPKLLLTPDIAICSSCKKEIHDELNKRFGYAFTTCTQCGPRFSIMQNVPYDRETTTMKSFAMCKSCDSEYGQVEDKRFYSQTNSCPDCGVALHWLSNEPAGVEPLLHLVRLLHAGKIVAVKGIGGFLLLVDAGNKKAIERLRIKKMRPKKPLACLFQDVEQLRRFAFVSELESTALQSAEAPIVLVKTKKKKQELALAQLAPGLNRIGAMLPYAPLLELISLKAQMPLVATSGNASGSPIVFTDDEAMRLLSPIADAILSHNREITFPQDDSVIAYSPKFQQKIIFRRGRGLAPSVDFPAGRLSDDMLAMGAEMKSAFAFTANGNTYLSQYLGDTSTFESQNSFDISLRNLRALMKPEIKGVAVDKHPNYHSSQIGIALAEEQEWKLFKVQHHKAHFAAVLAEHDLLQSEEPILGVVWDGLGYGDDGHVWGSEFFVLNENDMERVHHIENYPMIASNRMALEPAMAAYAILWPENPGKVWLRKSFSQEEQDVFPQLAENPKQLSASMGRLFDAVAGILELKKVNTYEGEAAMALQVLAEKSKINIWNPYCIALCDNTLDAQYLLHNVDNDKKNQVKKEDIAFRFHQTLVQWIGYVADVKMTNKIAFSGGVFQNTLLVDMIIDRLGKSNKLYFHKVLPPNDECIAIGQLAFDKLGGPKYVHVKNNESDKICV